MTLKFLAKTMKRPLESSTNCTMEGRTILEFAPAINAGAKKTKLFYFNYQALQFIRRNLFFGLNILIHFKEVARIIFGFHHAKFLIIVTIGSFDSFLAFFHHKIHIRTAG